MREQATSGKLTEEQAKNKLCCNPSRQGELCQASECMAWQWCSEAGYTEQDMKDNNVAGFCGFVGGPYPIKRADKKEE